MRISRLFVHEPLAAGARLTLGADEANYLGRVLRARSGDAVVLFDGRGGEYTATITSLGKRHVDIDVDEYRGVDREATVAITLLQGLARGERMDYVVQKATELGVACIVPVVTDHCQVHLDGTRRERRREHWVGVATAAAQQCGRTALPDVTPVVALADAIAALPEDTLRLAVDIADAGKWPAGKAASVALAVGPEGGFSDAERQALAGAGFVTVGLGPRVLRTETAAIVALTLAMQRYGDLG